MDGKDQRNSKIAAIHEVKMLYRILMVGCLGYPSAIKINKSVREKREGQKGEKSSTYKYFASCCQCRCRSHRQECSNNVNTNISNRMNIEVHSIGHFDSVIFASVLFFASSAHEDEIFFACHSKEDSSISVVRIVRYMFHLNETISK